MWCTVRDFVAAKETEEDIIQFIDEDDWQKMEDEIFDARNYHLKLVTQNMEVTSQISVAITKLQGITTALRVFFSLYQSGVVYDFWFFVENSKGSY